MSRFGTDIILNVLDYLNIYELQTVSQLSKQWNHAHKFYKRNMEIDIVILSLYNGCFEFQQNLGETFRHFTDTICEEWKNVKISFINATYMTMITHIIFTGYRKMTYGQSSFEYSDSPDFGLNFNNNIKIDYSPNHFKTDEERNEYLFITKIKNLNWRPSSKKIIFIVKDNLHNTNLLSNKIKRELKNVKFLSVQGIKISCGWSSECIKSDGASSAVPYQDNFNMIKNYLLIAKFYRYLHSSKLYNLEENMIKNNMYNVHLEKFFDYIFKREHQNRFSKLELEAIRNNSCYRFNKNKHQGFNIKVYPKLKENHPKYKHHPKLRKDNECREYFLAKYTTSYTTRYTIGQTYILDEVVYETITGKTAYLRDFHINEVDIRDIFLHSHG